MKTYKCWPAFLLLISCLGIMTLLGIYIGIEKLGRSDPVWFYILFMCFLGYGWYEYLRIPFEITIRADNLIEFRSVLKRTTVSPHEIESIKVWGGGMIKIKRKGGALRMLGQMDGFHDFISTVKSLHPSIELKGL